LLTKEERGEYLVILRYISEGGQMRFPPVRELLVQQGYTATLDKGPSSIGDMDIILCGTPSCNDAIDNLEIILAWKLDITHPTRMRLDFNDASYNRKNIAIRIKNADLFGSGF
jgi:hypothetical protein